MERRLKERLTGAAVLILLAVIFIPMILDNSVQDQTRITESNIPPRPETELVTRTIPPEPRTAPVEERTEVVETSSGGTGEDDEPDTPDGAIPASIPLENVVTDNAVPVPDQSDRIPTTNGSGNEQDIDKLNAWVIQLGSFESHDNATNLVEKLQKLGYPAFMEEVNNGTNTVHRVRIGPEVRRTDAETMLEELTARLKLEGIVLRYP